MSTQENLQVRLASRPEGMPGREHWSITARPIAQPAERGLILVKVAYLSVDPAMRGWLRKERSYIEPVEVGDVMRAGGVGTVVASRHPDLEEGDKVLGLTGIQSYALMDGDDATKISEELAPLPAYLGVLGMTGMTAYFGLLDVGQMAEGERVLISGAAGAVGSVAGQIARLRGAARVVGIAGGEDKCRHVVDDLGFHGAIDYRSEDVGEGIERLCPDGVDVYFDNVGGPILDAALLRLRRSARVVLCGAISQYNDMDRVRGPSNYLSLLVNRARMQGFIVFDYRDRFPEAFMKMAAWRAEGELVHRETIVPGIESFPETFQRLFSGDKLGKLIIEV